MKGIIAGLVALTVSVVNGQPGEPARLNQHRVTNSASGDSDDRQSWGYYNRAKEVCRLLGVPDRLQFVLTANGHKPNGPEVDAAWRAFLDRWLQPKAAPVRQEAEI